MVEVLSEETNALKYCELKSGTGSFEKWGGSEKATCSSSAAIKEVARHSRLVELFLPTCSRRKKN